MFAYHAQQCFYIKDVVKPNAWVALMEQPRDLHDMPEIVGLDNDMEDILLADMELPNNVLEQLVYRECHIRW